jgi:LysR family hydrogen peroxide-inducible transcriptional activator
MNIQQFQYVLAVVDLKNFEAAAERCFVTQSTLSTMIGRLEDELGIKIFNRKTKPVSITPDGAVLIERFRIIMSEVAGLENVVQELKGEMSGELKLGVIPTVAPYLLPLFLSQFAEQYPKITVVVKEMTTPQIQQALKTRALDIGILALPISDEEFIETPLYTEPFMVYDFRDEKSERKITLDTLDYSKIWLLQEGHCLRSQVYKICELSNNTPKSNVNFEFESGSMDSLLRITKASKGITIIPFLASIDLSESEQSNLIEFMEPVPARSVGLLTHKHFVKKQLLNQLKSAIKMAVKHKIPDNEQVTVVKPL